MLFCSLLSSLALLLLALPVWAQSPSQYRTNQRYIIEGGLALPANEIGAVEQAATTVVVAYGGELAENGTIYMGPLPITTPDAAIDAAGYDAQTNATEGTADAPVLVGGTFRPMAMRCVTNGTLGSGETLTLTLRAATASVQAGGADFACAMAEAETTCEAHANGDTLLAANTATAIRAVMASNNGDGDDVKCLVWYQVE